jgi:hypothetical protein
MGFAAVWPGHRAGGKATVLTGLRWALPAGRPRSLMAAGWHTDLPPDAGTITYVGVTYAVSVRTVTTTQDGDTVVLDETATCHDERMDVALRTALTERLEDWGVQQLLGAIAAREVDGPVVVEKAWTAVDLTTVEICSDDPRHAGVKPAVVWLD